MRGLRVFLARTPYVLPVMCALVIAAVLLSLELKTETFVLSGFGFQVMTGTVLVAMLGYQWLLFVRRVSRNNRNARMVLVRHRWMGVAVTFLFALHVVRFGYVWMGTLSVVMFLIAVTGVINREVLRYRSNLIYLIWLVCHVGLSAALVPLVAVHIWVALAYQ